jgi:hypothetical protein
MKAIRKFLMVALAVGFLSAVGHAQKDDKRPPKNTPPVVNPQPKHPPKEDKGKRPKRPDSYFGFAHREELEEGR